MSNGKTVGPRIGLGVFIAVVFASLGLLSCGGGNSDNPTEASKLGCTIASGCVQVTGGPIALSLVSSRVSGIAPLAVFFDATGTTASSTHRPFHDLEYRWDFGDVGSGTWNAGSRAGVSSRNTATGPVAAHVFETPGTYTIALTTFNGTNTVSNNSVQITVRDPDTVPEFAGANTACFSTSGNFTGCPAGANQVTTSDFGTVANSATLANTVRRLLLRRGETWTAASSGIIAVNGPGIVGAFGSGALAPPVIQAVSPLKDSAFDAAILILSSATTPNISDWRVMELKFDSGSGSHVLGVDAGGGINQVTLLRLAGNDLRITVQFNPALLDACNNDASPTRHGHTIYDQIAIVDANVPVVHHGEVGDSSTFGYGTYIAGERVFYAGNTIDNAGTGTADVSHVARFPYLGRAVISNNSLSRPGPTEHNIKLLGPTWRTLPSVTTVKPNGVEGNGVGDGSTRWVVISDNKFVGANNPWMVAVGPQNTIIDMRVKDVIYERNWSLAGAGTQSHLIVWAQEVTARNNIFDTTGALHHNGVTVTRRGIEPAPDQVRMYNNTVYSADAGNDFVAVDVNATAKNVKVKNNLAYAPLDTSHLMASGTGNPIAPLVTSNNSSNAQVLIDPLFAGPLSAPAGFALTGASYAKDAVLPYPLDPLAPPVFSDFFTPTTPLVFRPVGGMTDFGATEQ